MLSHCYLALLSFAGPALEHCTTALHCITALHHCTASLHCITVLEHCTASLQWSTALQHCSVSLYWSTALQYSELGLAQLFLAAIISAASFSIEQSSALLLLKITSAQTVASLLLKITSVSAKPLFFGIFQTLNASDNFFLDQHVKMLRFDLIITRL